MFYLLILRIAGKSSTGAANGWLTKNESENTPTRKNRTRGSTPRVLSFHCSARHYLLEEILQRNIVIIAQISQRRQ